MDDFRKEVIKELEKKLGDGYRVFPKDQRKNNEVFLHGICIREGESPIVPVVYVDEFMVPYIIGILTPENVADMLLESLSQGTIPLDIAEDVKDFEKIKEMVSIRLVNHAANARELENRPHRRFLDLAIVYYLDMEMAMPGQSGAGVITDTLMEIWGIPEDELYRLGMEKLLAKDACRTVELLSLLRQFGLEEENGPEEKVAAESLKDRNLPELYVASNRKHFYGASCMLNTAFLEKMAEDKGCSLMIYPGSVHEVIILPQKNRGGECLDAKSVQEINRHCTLRDEWLSNSVYRYDREKQEICIYEKGEPL